MIIQRLVKKNFYYPTGYRNAAPQEEKGDGGINWEVGTDIYIYVLLLLSCLSCPTLCDPRDGSLPGSSVPGILQARTLEWVAISFSNA